MSDRPFVLRADADLPKLAAWIKPRTFDGYALLGKDRGGSYMLGLSENSGSRRWEKAGMILCATGALSIKAEALVRERLGWDPIEITGT